MSFVLLPYYSLKPNALTLYKRIEWLKPRLRNRKGLENLKDNTNIYGELSAHSQKRLRKAIDYMIFMTQEKTLQTKQGTHSQAHTTPIHYHLTFITLTLPSKQIHTDKEIKAKCLNTFLNTLRRKHKSDLYIWKAEKQENGNIHFHIICDKYIHWTTIRADWNRIVNKLGYVDRYSEKMKKYYKNGFRLSDNPNDKRTNAQQFASYTRAKKTGYTNPNSTDIHALYKIKNLSAYISKYMAKGVTKTDRIKQLNTLRNIAPSELSDQQKQQLEKLKSQGVQGRIWGCSQKLSKTSNYTELCRWSDIVEIDKVLKYKTGTYTIELGDQEIITYTFDLEKFPKLKEKLKKHLSLCQSEKENQTRS